MLRPTLVLLLAAIAAGCGTGSTSTPTLPPLVTPGITPSPARVTPTPPASPSAPPWPAGWGDAFCAAFDELVIAQQLARDIGRALAEEDRDDAIGLAHELGRTVVGVRELLGEVPAWVAAEDLLVAANALLDEDEQLVTFYLRYLEQDREPALDRALETEAALRDQAVPAVETELAQLATQGVACPAGGFDLESP